MACLYLVLLFVGVSLAATPTCKKSNDCACTPTDTNVTGIVNFYPLVNSADAKPVFMVNGTSQQTKDEYTFMYNPCVGFSMASSIISNPCKTDLICQKAVKYNFTYGLGAVGSASFVYVKDDLFVYYYSKSTINRTSEVKLICDENEAHGKFMYIAEPKTYYYQFNFTSMCACPGKCPNKTMLSDKWVKTDSVCVYRKPRSGKVLNLQGLDTPLKVVIDEYTTYYYNPCDKLIMSNQCNDVAVCQQDLSTSPPTYRGAGSTEPELREEDGSIVLHYPSVDGGKCFEVTLVCDEVVDKPILISDGNNKMVLKSKNACIQ